MTSTYNVTARRWEHGWELRIDGVGVTQSPTRGAAEQAVRDYIETLTGNDVSDCTVVITPDPPPDRKEGRKEGTWNSPMTPISPPSS